MKPYPEYKDSGVEWIGEIPAGWETKKLKFATEVLPSNVDKHIHEEEIQVRLCNYTDVYYNEKINKNLTLKKGSCTEAEYQKFSIQKNYVILTKDSEARDDIGIPALVEEDLEDVVCGYHLTMLKPLTIDGNYLYRFIQSSGTRKYFELNSNGVTRFGLGKSSIENLIVPQPSKDEQQQIVSHLDIRTQQIDELIQNKEQKIKLLQEKRTAVINQAVTKGLNPDAEMKDSGVEWIGEIPKGWKKKKIKHLTSKIGSGVTPKGGAEVYKTSGIPILRSQNIHFDGLHLSEVAFITREIHESMYRSQVKPNDILLNITGASLGRCCVVPDNFSEANVNQHVCILRTLTDLDSSYLNYCLSSNVGQTQIWMGENGTAREGLNFESLGNITLFTPSFYEQTKIVSDLDTKTQQIDQLISKEQRKIELLKEYRQSLISDAVTGKIDVRDVA